MNGASDCDSTIKPDFHTDPLAKAISLLTKLPATDKEDAEPHKIALKWRLTGESYLSLDFVSALHLLSSVAGNFVNDETLKHPGTVMTCIIL